MASAPTHREKTIAVMFLAVCAGFFWTIGTRMADSFVDLIFSIFGWPVG